MQTQGFIANDGDVLNAIADTDGYTFALTKANTSGGQTVLFYDVSGAQVGAKIYDGASNLIGQNFYDADGLHEAKRWYAGGTLQSDTLYDASGVVTLSDKYTPDGRIPSRNA